MEITGILGGSYNPATRAHLHVADESQRLMDLHEVWMWMSYNIFKDRANYASLEDRSHILNLSTRDRPWIKNQTMEKDFCGSMTANSLILLQAMYPNRRFVWIIGDDNFASFHTWDHARHKIDGIVVPDWRYIMHNFPVAVLHRPGSRRDAQNSIAAHHFAHNFVKDPRDLGRSAPNGWSFLKNTPMEVSSTRIRSALRSHRRNIRGLFPEAEDFIYEKGLFNTRRDFNAAAAPAPVPNTVPLQTFTLLAATANLVKTVLANSDRRGLVAHAAACWDKSEAKGDFGKSEEIPGEIADNLISLYWLADLQKVSLPSSGHETQDSVSRWCDKHYPGEELYQRAKNCLEELTELCVCEGMEKDRMVNLLGLILDERGFDAPDAVYTKTLARLQDYAEILNINLGGALDTKMQENRIRNIEQSAARNAAKIQTMNGPK